MSLDPSSWILRFAGLVKAGDVLDLACGAGRHGRVFLENDDLTVHFVDRDTSRLQDLVDAPRACLHQIDLEDGRPFPFDTEQFSGICVTNYLYRPHLNALIAALAPGGVLLYETFAKGNERFGKPSRPDFLLAPGELLECFGKDMHVVAYEHGQSGDKVIQRLCAVKQPSDPSRIEI